MRRMLSTLLMAGTLAAPLAVPTSVFAGEPRGRAIITVRTNDPYRRDYRLRQLREERAYRAYLAERHRAYQRYQRQRLAERRAYWRWHHHRDGRFDDGRR